MDLLRSYAPATEHKPAAKAKAKAPKARAAKPAHVGEPAPKKVRVAEDSTSKPERRKKRKAGFELDEEVTDLSDLLGTELCEADNEVVQQFREKLDDLKCLNPPLADSGFKNKLTETSTALNQMKADLKAKKRSALRRAQKENDPLYIALDVVEKAVMRVLQLVRCGST